jgi:hypothetical protein
MSPRIWHGGSQREKHFLVCEYNKENLSSVKSTRKVEVAIAHKSSRNQAQHFSKQNGFKLPVAPGYAKLGSQAWIWVEGQKVAR